MSGETRVELTCKRCGRTHEKTLKADEMIGPHKDVKPGHGLAHREPGDIVTRREGYGTMAPISCDTCGSLKHDIRHLNTEADP